MPGKGSPGVKGEESDEECQPLGLCPSDFMHMC